MKLSKPQFVGEKVKLGELCDICSGGTPKRSVSEYWNEGSIPWVKISDISNKKYVYSTEEQITKEGLKCSSAKVLAPGTLLYSIFASIGAVGILEIPAATNQAIAGLSINTGRIERDYLYHYLKSQEMLAKSSGRGAAQTNINLTILRGMEVPVPPIDDQRAIAEQFEEVAAQIEKAKLLRNQLDHLVKSRFVEMFGDPVANPMGWGVSTIKKTAVTYGDGPFGSSLKSADYVPSGVRVIRLGNVMRGRFSEKDQSYVSYEKFESLKRYECIPGEVIIATLGDSILRACIVPDFGVPSIHKADCMYYETDKEKVLPVFAMCAINHPSMLRRALLYSHGQTRARINSTQAGNLPMVLPPIALQKEFVSFVAQVDKSRFIAQQQIEKLQMLYDSLAQEYFGD